MSEIKKHAYCIIAHADPYCLHTLLELIDDPRNDVYLLFDKKSDRAVFGDLSMKESNLTVLPAEIDIRWGDLSQVEAELFVFEEALESGTKYEFIHLISGCDLPLHGQDYIHDFCSRLPDDTNLIGFIREKEDRIDMINKTRYYHFLTGYFRHPNRYIRRLARMIRGSLIELQKFLGVKRDWKNYELGKGCNWASLRPGFIAYLIERKKEILRRFRFVKCPDEIYKHTMLLSSSFRNTRMKGAEEYDECMRKIDWERGIPYTWTNSELEELIASDAFFARKFSSETDQDVIKNIRDYLKK